MRHERITEIEAEHEGKPVRLAVLCWSDDESGKAGIEAWCPAVGREPRREAGRLNLSATEHLAVMLLSVNWTPVDLCEVLAVALLQDAVRRSPTWAQHIEEMAAKAVEVAG